MFVCLFWAKEVVVLVIMTVIMIVMRIHKVAHTALLSSPDLYSDVS